MLKTKKQDLLIIFFHLLDCIRNSHICTKAVFIFCHTGIEMGLTPGLVPLSWALRLSVTEDAFCWRRECEGS